MIKIRTKACSLYCSPRRFCDLHSWRYQTLQSPFLGRDNLFLYFNNAMAVCVMCHFYMVLQADPQTVFVTFHLCVDQERDRVPDPLPLENHKAIWFLSNAGQVPLKNHKSTKPAFNVESFQWRFVGKLMMAHLNLCKTATQI